MDFSDIPAFIAALMFGPLAAILVELFKNIIDYLMAGAKPVYRLEIWRISPRQLFVLPTYFVFKRLKMKKGLACFSRGRYIIYGCFYEYLKLCSHPASLYDFMGFVA